MICLLLIPAYSLAGKEVSLQPGQKYKTIKTIHITGVYNDPNDRRISKETATASLAPKKYANKKSWYGFQKEVPAGTVMTIVRPIPKPWYLPFADDEYLVKLDPDLSEGLDVEIKLFRGFEGSLDGLNPEIFIREADSK